MKKDKVAQGNWSDAIHLDRLLRIVFGHAQRLSAKERRQAGFLMVIFEALSLAASPTLARLKTDVGGELGIIAAYAAIAEILQAE
nr:hypothetical protein CIT39_07365 [Bradyrhizobium symbiodeficiens]